MEYLDMDYMGPLLKNARIKANLTQDEIAERLGVTSRYISAIENEGKCPALELWVRMIRLLNTSADAIVYPEQMAKQDDPLIRMISMLSDRDRKIIVAAIQAMLNDS